ncbi:MAG: ROK family protein [Chloroflexi bacterium]|nr:ROK family protein [Chloroflexota bacterium]
MTQNGSILAVDLGGTRIRVARLNRALDVEARVEDWTRPERGPDDAIDRMVEMLQSLWPQSHAGVDVGIAAPGPLDPHSGVLLSPPNLKWHNVPLKAQLEARLGVSVWLGNDADAAALAEGGVGAGRGFDHFVYLTVSTGIGSGVILDGRLHTGARGLATEAGLIPMLVGPDGPVLTLEDLAAGPDMVRAFQARVAAGETSDLAAGEVDITTEAIGMAARNGDALSIDVIAKAGRVFGLGVITLLQLFNPQRIVVGGGASQLAELYFGPAWDAIRQYCADPAFYDGVDMVAAECGADVGLIGAGMLVLTNGGKTRLSEVAALLGRSP